MVYEVVAKTISLSNFAVAYECDIYEIPGIDEYDIDTYLGKVFVQINNKGEYDYDLNYSKKHPESATVARDQIIEHCMQRARIVLPELNETEPQ